MVDDEYLPAEEQLLAFIKERGPVRWMDLEKRFTKEQGWSKGKFVNHFTFLRKTKKIKKKLDEKTGRPVYYIGKESTELAEKAVLRENIRINRFIPRMKIRVNAPASIAGSVGYLVTDKDSCVKTVVLDLGKDFGSTLASAVDSDEKRRELGRVLLSFIKLYSTGISKEVGFFADYFDTLKTVLFAGRFPVGTSETMRAAIEKGYFSNYYELLRGLYWALTNRTWEAVWNKLQDSDFRDGKNGLRLEAVCRYDKDEKRIKTR